LRLPVAVAAGFLSFLFLLAATTTCGGNPVFVVPRVCYQWGKGFIDESPLGFSPSSGGIVVFVVGFLLFLVDGR